MLKIKDVNRVAVKNNIKMEVCCMKKIFCLFTMAVFVCVATALYANGIAQSSHFTAKHIAGMNDNTGDETAMYDPASVVWLKDGIYINVSSFTVLDSLEAKVESTKYEGSANAWTVPAASVTYKQDQFAGFLYFNVLDGAPFAKLKWDDGTFYTYTAASGVAALLTGSSITSTSVEASSTTYNITLGGAYKINDMFSVALGGRYIYYTKEVNNKFSGEGIPGTYSVDTNIKETANGFGGVVGLNVVPAHGYLIGLTYATAIKREYDITVDPTVTATGAYAAAAPSVAAGIKATLGDGKKARYDIPAMATLTAAGMPVMGTIIALQINYMFNKQADWEEAEKEYNNTIVYMLALTQYLNQQLRFSLGVMYADKGIKDDGAESLHPDSEDVNPVLDELGFGLGAAYNINENLNVGLTYSYTYYMEGEAFGGVEKLNKTRHLVGVQVGYKI